MPLQVKIQSTTVNELKVEVAELLKQISRNK